MPDRRLVFALALVACAPGARGAPGAGAPSATSAAGTASAGTPRSAVADGPVVIVVRHAEKAPTPGDDPALSAAGEARARALAAALHDAGVTTIITTQLQRTGLTAAPLAAALGLRPTTVGTSSDVAQHAAAVAAAARGARGTVLVVGHSNTVGPIVAALGGPPGVRLCDAQYATLHVVVPDGARGARLVRSFYGAADPEVDDRCAVVSR